MSGFETSRTTTAMPDGSTRAVCPDCGHVFATYADLMENGVRYNREDYRGEYYRCVACSEKRHPTPKR